MQYRIESETKSRIRIRLYSRKLSPEQAEILQYALSHAPGVTRVTIYRQTAGCAITYTGDRSQILRRLDSFCFENVRMMAKAEEEKAAISMSEMKDRKLDPGLKRRLRMRILAEALADKFLPLPVQLAYHAYQLVTLRNV